MSPAEAVIDQPRDARLARAHLPPEVIHVLERDGDLPSFQGQIELVQAELQRSRSGTKAGRLDLSVSDEGSHAVGGDLFAPLEAR